MAAWKPTPRGSAGPFRPSRQLIPAFLQLLRRNHIPRPARGFFHGDQIVQADHEQREPAERSLHSGFPSRFEGKFVRYRGQDVDAPPGHSDLIEVPRRGKELRLQIAYGRAKSGQRPKKANRIAGRGVNPEVQVLGVERLSVLRHRVATDHQKPGAFGCQCGQ